MRLGNPLRTLLSTLLLVTGLAVPLLVAAPAGAVLDTSSTLAVQITGHGVVTATNGPACTSPSTNPGGTAANPSGGTPYACPTADTSGFDHCTTDSSPDGSSSTQCSVTLTASVATGGGWRFDHWSGSCSGTSTTCTGAVSSTDCDPVLKPPCRTTYADLAPVAHFVDTRAPGVTIGIGPDQHGTVWSADRSARFGFVADEDGQYSGYADEGVYFECRVGSASWGTWCPTGVTGVGDLGWCNPSPLVPVCPTLRTYTLSGLADGTHSFCVRATDASGLVGSPACREWAQETPVVTTLLSHPATFTQDSATPVRFTYTSNKAAHVTDGSTLSYRCRLDDGAEAACPASGTSYGPLPNGVHHFTVAARFTSAYGSVAQVPTTFEWTQSDNTGPTVYWSAPQDQVVAGPHAPIAWTADGTTHDVTCALDAATAAPCASPFTVPVVADGVHTLHLVARDAIGNRTSRSFTWDQHAAPTVRVASGPAQGASVGGTSVHFTFNTPASGVEYLCALDGQARTPCTSPDEEHVSGLAAGRHTLVVTPRYTSSLGSHLDGATVTRTWSNVPAPRCSLAWRTHRVLRSKVWLKAKCAPTAVVAIRGVALVETHPHHWVKVKVPAIRKTVRKGAWRYVELPLPRTVVSAVLHRKRVYLVASMTGRTIGGKSYTMLPKGMLTR